MPLEKQKHAERILYPPEMEHGHPGGSKQAAEEYSGDSSSKSSTGSSGSRGRNDSLLLRNGRYRRVPTEAPEMADEGKNMDELLEPNQIHETEARHWQPSSFSETEVVTDSENVSESNTDGFSDGNTDIPDFDILRVRDSSSQQRLINKDGATEKISTVCNEIKQRFQPDFTNTDDENVI